jgi:hypothetical protein
MRLIKTPLYKNLNVTIHHQWASLFALHMNLKFKIPTYNKTSFDNYDSHNEKRHCTPIYSMIHNFLPVPKKWIVKILYILLSQVKNFVLWVYLNINI